MIESMPHEAFGCIEKIQVHLSFSGIFFVIISVGVGMGVQLSVAGFFSLLEICPTGQVPRETVNTLHL